MNTKRSAARKELEKIFTEDSIARAFMLWHEENERASARQAWIINIIFLFLGWAMGQITLPYIATHLLGFLH